MRKLPAKFIAIVFVAILASAVALAEKKRDTIVLDKDTMVSGTLVKAGTYQAQFDFKTDTLSIMKESGKVVATAAGKLEARPHKSDQTRIETNVEGSDQILTSITSSGDNHTIMIGGGEARPGTGQ